MTEPEFIDPSQLKPGPIRHRTLSPQHLESIKAVYDLIGPYLTMNLEQFEIGFMRDMHPEREIEVWQSIAGAWLLFHQRHLSNVRISAEDEGHLIGTLVALSCGTTDSSTSKVTEAVAAELGQCYIDFCSSEQL